MMQYKPQHFVRLVPSLAQAGLCVQDLQGCTTPWKEFVACVYPPVWSMPAALLSVSIGGMQAACSAARCFGVNLILLR